MAEIWFLTNQSWSLEFQYIPIYLGVISLNSKFELVCLQMAEIWIFDKIEVGHHSSNIFHYFGGNPI